MIRYFRSKGAAWSIACKNNNRRPMAESSRLPPAMHGGEQ
jgi:hypothetical protein